MHATLDVTGNTDIDGTLDVSGDVDMHATLDVTGNSTFAADIDVDGVSNLDNTDIDGTLDVSGDVDMHATLDVTGNTDIDGTFDAAGATNLQSTLTVAGNTDLNGDLDVDGVSNLDITDIDGTLDVSESVNLNSDGTAGTVLTINDAAGMSAITVTTSVVNQQTNATSTTLTVPSLVVEESANYTGNMSIGGNLTVTNNVTAATAPIVGSHLTNKDYVDAQITTAITSPELFTYDAISSSSTGDAIYYINGDLLLYATEMGTGGISSGNFNYTIELKGSNLADIVGATLHARGLSEDLTDADHGWAYDLNDNSIKFDMDYNSISTLAGAQVDGYVSCSLVFEYGSAGARKNSGLTLRFYLDSANLAPALNTFQE